MWNKTSHMGEEGTDGGVEERELTSYKNTKITAHE